MVSPQGAVDGAQFFGLFTLCHVRHRIRCLGVLEREREGGRETVSEGNITAADVMLIIYYDLYTDLT